jgi:hypothetical protein
MPWIIAHKTDLFRDHDMTIARAEPKLIPVFIVSPVYVMIATSLLGFCFSFTTSIGVADLVNRACWHVGVDQKQKRIVYDRGHYIYQKRFEKGKKVLQERLFRGVRCSPWMPYALTSES